MKQKITDMTKRVRILPIHERWKLCSKYMWYNWINLTANIAKTQGWDKANEFIVRVAQAEGVNDAKSGLQKNSEREATAALRAGMYGLLNTSPSMLKARAEITEYSPHRIIARVHGCTEFDVAKETGVENVFDMPKVCDTWWKSLAKTVNPKLNVEFDKMICKGDDYCQWVIEEE
jgi:hypothetical protein